MNRFRAILLLCLSVVLMTAGRAAAQKTNSAASAASAPDNSLCLSCHEEVGSKIKGHVHSSVGCANCHARHEEYPHPEGVAKPLCSTCHSSMAKDYARSAHAQAARKGNGAAPECTTCHGQAHEIDSAKTSQFRTSVPELCGACHSDISGEYQQSVHGQAVSKGIMQAPVCTDCHGEHSILPPKDSASSVNPNHVRDTCGSCHNSVALSRRFGLPPDRVVSFDASYHGLASKSGAQTVANCSSCHGIHNIRASKDPNSTIHPANLARTCGQCHVGAGKRFALGPIHAMNGPAEHASLRWVRWFYSLIIPLTLGFMFLHNFGDWIHKVRRLRFSASPPPAPVIPVDQPLRTLAFERVEHAALVVSFIVLAWTGFALKYPDQWWSRPLLLWENSFALRGIVHRAASVVFMSAALAHVLSLVLSKRLRDHWRALLPTMQDVRELAANFAYNLGLRKQQPGRAAHSYVEKLEYWALVWGSVIMVVTGILLWTNNLMLRWLPKLALDLATSVHFYEAVLATLAIVVWHFYFVIFDPDVYPMDSAWLTGKSPRKEPAGEASR
jgi:cytochrome b subunit of formate dehydrogenase